jgi:hypothetical protein
VISAFLIPSLFAVAPIEHVFGTQETALVGRILRTIGEGDPLGSTDHVRYHKADTGIGRRDSPGSRRILDKSYRCLS